MALPKNSGDMPLRSTVQVKRLQRISRSLNVVPLDPEQDHYLVESESQPMQFYEVCLTPDAVAGSCTCPWSQHGGINCKHIMAALRTRYGPHDSISFWRTYGDARRQHRRLLVGNHLFATLLSRRRRA